MSSTTPKKRVEEAALPEEQVLEAKTATAHQFVTFATGSEVFAVGMDLVQEIIRAPEVVRVPLAPATLEGLANLRGKVLPIISLRGLFGFPRQEHDDATRVVVVDVGQALGFVVDRVSSVIEVEPEKIEDVGTISSTVDTKLLTGLIKDVGGHSMIMILDFARLVEREFSDIAAVSRSSGLSDSMVGGEEVDRRQAIDELQLVSFHVNEQEYAVGIDAVQEIVQVPEKIAHVPHSESHVLGVMTLRNKLLPLVSLRRLFGLPERELDEKSRIVVLVFGGSSVGLSVDGVNEVLRVPKTAVDPMPMLLAREEDLTDITEICRLDEGKRLVSIITVKNLFRNSAVKAALAVVVEVEKEAGTGDTIQERAMDEDEQVVVFRLDKEEFGVPITNVEEIVRVPENLTRVPKAPAYVEGVINLRGTVLPVLDLRLRMGMAQVARNDRQRIMVFRISNVRTGFIVDQVAEVLKIPQACIGAAPQLSNEQGRLLSRVANLEAQKRIVQLLDSSHLVAGKELAEIAAVTSGEADDQAADR